MESKHSYSDNPSWQDYEELVKDIYQGLGQASGVTVECWGKLCRVKGLSGVSHQIDVLTNHSDGVHQYRTGISCKYWKEKVGLSVVTEFAQIVQDTRLDKGVMVSKMGFTSPAITFAKSRNIGLVELREPLDKDWEGYVREVHITMMISQTKIDDLHLQLTAPKPKPGEEVYQGGIVNWPIPLNKIFIGLPGKEAETLQKLVDTERRKYPGQEKFSFQFPKGSVVTTPDYPEYPAHGYSITGASLKVRNNPPITEEIVIRPEDIST